jgi:large subunit ribosomal protein L3
MSPGTSKGKGFAGAGEAARLWRWPKITHGQSDRQRAVGSLGAGLTPGSDPKGMRGPGHMGNERVTVLNLRVVLVDPERNLLACAVRCRAPMAAWYIRSRRPRPG